MKGHMFCPQDGYNESLSVNEFKRLRSFKANQGSRSGACVCCVRKTCLHRLTRTILDLLYVSVLKRQEGSSTVKSKPLSKMQKNSK